MKQFFFSVTFALTVCISTIGWADFHGVNLAGAEFTPNKVPGALNIDFIFPTNGDVDIFFSKGATTIRLPLLWERIQPRLMGSLSSSYVSEVDRVVQYVTIKKRGFVILDIHNYGRFKGTKIGSVGVPTRAFSDLWRKLANRYKENSNVLFGMMNEPYGFATESWYSISQNALDSIRATGAQNYVLASGNAWSGAHSWMQNWYGTPNGVAMSKLEDKAGRLMFDVHQYFDSDSSGGHLDCVSPTQIVDRLREFEQWAKDRKVRAILGEFGVANSASCLDSLKGLLEHLKNEKSVWAGSTYWAAGRWWGDYPFSVHPPKGAQQLNLLTQFWKAALD